VIGLNQAQQSRLAKFIAAGIPLPTAIILAMSSDDQIMAEAQAALAMTNTAINQGRDLVADVGMDVLQGKPKKAKKKVKSAAQRAYAKAFKKVQSKYKLKSGKWKKGGFKRAVKEAHKLAKRSMK
tara:strand:- start:1329 stop:1703 length:375 start_codon:yes stop_codon:yes gene_type:complete